VLWGFNGNNNAPSPRPVYVTREIAGAAPCASGLTPIPKKTAKDAGRLVLPHSIALTTLRRKGLLVRFTSPTAGRAWVRVLRGTRALASKPTTVTSRRTSAVRLRPRLPRSLRRRTAFALKVRVTLPDRKHLRGSVRVRASRAGT
jgi:hypothetical protein